MHRSSMLGMAAPRAIWRGGLTFYGRWARWEAMGLHARRQSIITLRQFGGPSMTRFVAVACAIAIGPAVAPAEVITKPIEYKDGTTALEGVLVYDAAGTGKRPGVLLAHELGAASTAARTKAAQIARLRVRGACHRPIWQGPGPEGQSRRGGEAWPGRQGPVARPRSSHGRSPGHRDAAAGRPETPGRSRLRRRRDGRAGVGPRQGRTRRCHLRPRRHCSDRGRRKECRSLRSGDRRGR